MDDERQSELRAHHAENRRRRKAIAAMIKKLEQMRIDRGASENEAAFAMERRRELEAELATMPQPAPFLPQYMHRLPSTPGRKTSTTAKPTLYVEVTERALIQRINRALPRGQKLKIARGKTAQNRGLFYLVRRGEIIDPNVDMEALGRKLRVLRFHERMIRDQNMRKSEREAFYL